MKGDYVFLALKEIRRRRLRSVLTLIGIIIGIAAVVSLIMLGQGLKSAIEGQFDALGNDKLFITPKGNAFSPGLSVDSIQINEKDLEVVRDTLGIKIATGFATTTAKIEFNDNIRYFVVFGQSTNPEERQLLGESQNYKVEVGRGMQKGEKSKITLGYSYTQDTLFGKSVELGDKVKVHNQDFEVVGFLGKIGSPPDDTSVGMALETYEDLFETKGNLGMIIAQIQPGEDITQVAQRVEKNLRKSRDLKENQEDFTIQTPEELQGSFSIILDIVQAVLLGIAAISLLVGAVNVMNTMYTSVLERTRQIGILKALGARNEHILTLFLVESGFYGLGGGIIGAIIGISFAKLVEYLFVIFVGPAFLSVTIDPLFIAGVLAFSFIVGTLSGILPARQASKLNPVEALRYE